MPSLVAHRKESESWRDAVKRIAGEYGLEYEALTAYDQSIAEDNLDEPTAAFEALYDWDLLDYEEDDVKDPIRVEM